MQVDLNPRPGELALPAFVARRMLTAAVDLAQSFGTVPALLGELQRLRALLACVLMYLTCSRPVSITALPYDRLTLDLSVERGFIIRRTYVKTSQGLSVDRPGRYALTLPSAHFAPLISALLTFDSHRLLHTGTKPDFFFYLPDDQFVQPPQANGFLAGPWLTLALSVVGLSPPDGFTWTPRSMRSGAASAMEAHGTPRSKIEFWGGWAIGSQALAQHYIDPAMPPSADARWFFGHLTTERSAAIQWQPLPDPN